MMQRSLRTSLVIGLLGCLLAAPTFVFGQVSVRSLRVFGDSLSDPGNLFALTKMNNVPPSYDVDAQLVPDSQYAMGGHHMSNGPTWIEDLAKSLGIARSAAPAWRAGASPAANYAVAAARAYDAPWQQIDLPEQVSRFLGDLSGQSAPSDALYVIEFGGNDIRDALFSQDPSILDASLTSIYTEISRLYYQAGARKFLVVNVPSIGLLPSVRLLNPALAGLGGPADTATIQYNLGLAGTVGLLRNDLSDVQILEFDLYALIKEIYLHKEDFGLTNVEDACITPDVAPYKCADPDEYAFWDGIHPTKAVHAIIAQRAAQMLAQ